MLVHEVEKLVYQEKEVEVIIEVESDDTSIEDTAQEAADVWVEHFIQPMSVNGVDILWVIDPSGSMSNDRAQIIDGIADMMAVLPTTGWRLAIIPTDYRRAELVAEFPLIPGDTAADAEAMFYNVIGGVYEAGFDASYGYIMNNPYAQTWMRHDAALLIVFVSDEDEQSNEYFNNYNEFTSWVSAYRQSVFVSSIINLDPAVSVCEHTSLLNVGNEYMAATNHFNGQIIDICHEDWSSGVLDASNQISPYEYWDLAHLPLYNDRIYVFIDGVPSSDWYYEPTENRVYFTVIPDGGALVEVAYYYQ
tara:strand:- start:1622 stop:2536 length:915 start_codon:yes stop_codon:yes gene_type:complete